MELFAVLDSRGEPIFAIKDILQLMVFSNIWNGTHHGQPWSQGHQLLVLRKAIKCGICFCGHAEIRERRLDDVIVKFPASYSGIKA